MPRKNKTKEEGKVISNKEKNEKLQEMVEDLNKNPQKSPVMEDPKFQEQAQQFNPTVVDKSGKVHQVKPLGLHQEAYMVRRESKVARVCDPKEKIDVDYAGCQLVGEHGTPYYSETHGDVMRVMLTKDGSTVAFREKDIVPVKKKSFSLGLSQKRYNEIFKKKTV